MTRDVPFESRPGQYLLEWVIPNLPPQSSQILEGEFNVLRTNPRSTIVLNARSAEGATADESLVFEIVPGAPPSPLSPSDRGAAPSLPPALPPPVDPQRTRSDSGDGRAGGNRSGRPTRSGGAQRKDPVPA